MPNTRQMNDDALSKKLDELATKKDIESLRNLVNSLHEHIDLQNKEIAALQERVNGQDIKISKLEDRIGVLSAGLSQACLLYTSPSPRDATLSRMPSSA